MIATIVKITSDSIGGTNGLWSAPAIAPATTSPRGRPSPAPMSAVMMLSWRTIRRTCRRVMPTARIMPISRVRSKTVSTSALTIPNRLTTTDRASST